MKKMEIIDKIFGLKNQNEEECFALKRCIINYIIDDQDQYEKTKSKEVEECINYIKNAIIHGIQKSIRDSINKKIIGQRRDILLRNFISLYQELVGNDFIEIIWNGINEQINAETINIIYSKLQGYYSEKRNNLMDKSLEN